ncbi:c-type cytochrome [Ectothiorhodospira lacustris]|uniref:c-type cytochrome n=1 Tax=Ectothiorhodospira lacustris TaxID=2899127 RepID=UPI001EE97894|nr:c-type cytochrome [Ectothiorhodospira lacustris]MCG5499258.1 cytochrome c4 [Ectothiorhodospira lacustris]
MKKLVLIAVATLGMSMSASLLAESGDPVRGKELSSPCVACHQADGNSVVPAWPKIAGKDEAYLLKQLQDYKAGRRSHALMNPQVAALEEEDLPHLAAYFASQTPAPGRTAAAAEKLALGKQIYFGGNTATGVAACVACHGPNGKGNPAAVFPSVSAQHGVYTLDQLKQFRDGLRANDPGRMMRNVAGRMTDEEMSAVAEYIASLPSK